MTKDEALKLALELQPFVHGLGKAILLDLKEALAQPEQEPKHFKLGYDAGVLETQLDQDLERNFCPRCGKRLMSALGPVSLHTCCPPNGRTFDDYGNKIL